jgi:hypothetical protein
MLDERLLAGPVPVQHAGELGYGYVRLVYERQHLLAEEVDQRVGRLALFPPRQVPGVVLDAVAVAGLAQHLEVVHRAHPEPLLLEELAPGPQPLQPLVQLLLDILYRLLQLIGRCEEMGRRPYDGAVQVRQHLSGERVHLGYPLDGLAEHVHSHGRLVPVRRVDVDDVAADAELPPVGGDVVALVTDVHQPPEYVLPLVFLPDLDHHHPVEILIGRPKPVYAGHRRDDYHVGARQERARGPVPEPVDLVVDRGVLLYVGVRARYVRLGLVVVVVGHEILDRVAGKELAELRVQLRGQRLVRREDERRPLDGLDDARHRERLARARHAEQDLVVIFFFKPLDKCRNRRRLVTLRHEPGLELQSRQVSHPVKSIAKKGNPAPCRTPPPMILTVGHPAFNDKGQ